MSFFFGRNESIFVNLCLPVFYAPNYQVVLECAASSVNMLKGAII